MLLRFRSKYGIHRVTCEGNDVFGNVVENWVKQLGVDVIPDSITISNQPGVHHFVKDIATQTVESLGFRHGELLTTEFSVKEIGGNESNDQKGLSVSVPLKQVETRSLKVEESELDQQLEKEDGLIQRSRSNFCRHGDKGMCEYCSPLPPWDKGYQEENNIKHMSFHAYLKQLNEVTNKKSSGSSYIPPLSEPSYRINTNCPAGHEPWPKGICSKCQPSAITLQQQTFRMVDHVEFQQSELVNQFIESWRTTGMQRFAYLYGYYMKYENVPLGIKAVVEAIWEPSQHDEQDGLTMDVQPVSYTHLFGG